MEVKEKSSLNEKEEERKVTRWKSEGRKVRREASEISRILDSYLLPDRKFELTFRTHSHFIVEIYILLDLSYLPVSPKVPVILQKLN